MKRILVLLCALALISSASAFGCNACHNRGRSIKASWAPATFPFKSSIGDTFLWHGQGDSWHQHDESHWEWIGVPAEIPDTPDEPVIPDDGECKQDKEIIIEREHLRRLNLTRACAVAVTDLVFVY